jgi:hypothetical protein
LTEKQQSLGRWLRWLAVAHAAFGVAVYRRELGEIAADGMIGAVPHHSDRAAALWFIGSAFPGWLVGQYVDLAAATGDWRAVRRAGLLGTGAGLAGALAMPRSPMWIQVLICAQIVHGSKQIDG